MKTLFTAEVISTGGRSGQVTSPDGVLNTTLGNPLEPGLEQIGPNPEVLFAGAYSACYHGALKNAAEKANLSAEGSEVRAFVSLIEGDSGGYRLEVELHAQIPGVSRKLMERLMAVAHETCPYSKALRGDTNVQLVVDEVSEATA